MLVLLIMENKSMLVQLIIKLDFMTLIKVLLLYIIIVINVINIILIIKYDLKLISKIRKNYINN